MNIINQLSAVLSSADSGVFLGVYVRLVLAYLKTPAA